MNNYRNKKKKLSAKYMLLIMTIGCVILIFASLTLNISGGPLNAAAGYIFVPMQKGINSAGQWISDKANDFKTLEEVQKENSKLKEQNDELTAQLTTIKLEKYELDHLRELLDLDENIPAIRRSQQV